MMLARVVSATLARAPAGARVALAEAIAWLVGGVLRVRRAHVREALARAGIGIPERAVYRRLAGHLVDLLVVAGTPGLRLVALTPEATAALGAARAVGPVVIAGSHTGNWELAAFALAETCPVAVVAKRQGVGAVDRYIRALRRRFGVSMIAPRGALAGATEALAAGHVVVMPIDQAPDQPRHGVVCSFLGRDALVDRGPFVLAKRARATVIVAACEGGRVHVLGTLAPEDVTTNARRATALLEAHVRAHPDSWLWLHRRWKHAEPGAAARARARG